MAERSNDIVVKITSGTISRAIIIAFLFIFLYRIRDLVLVVLTAIVIASSIEPATRAFARIRVGRVAAVLTTYIIAVSIILAVIYFLLPPLLGDLSNFLSTVPQYVGNVATEQNIGGVTATTNSLKSLSNDLTQSKSVVQSVTESLAGQNPAAGAPAKGTPVIDVINNVRNALSTFSGSFADILSLVFGGVFSSVMIVVLSFYFAVQEDGVGNFLRVITPADKEEYVVDLWRRSQRKIGYWMQGQILLALLVGVFAYLGLMILGIHDALLFGVSAALFEIIPLFGPVLAALPPVIAAFMSGGFTSAIAVALLFLVIQQFENHLIYPNVVKKIVGVPPILVIVALVAGAELAGFWGIILSVPIASALMEYFTDIEKRKHAPEII